MFLLTGSRVTYNNACAHFAVNLHMNRRLIESKDMRDSEFGYGFEAIEPIPRAIPFSMRDAEESVRVHKRLQQRKFKFHRTNGSLVTIVIYHFISCRCIRLQAISTMHLGQHTVSSLGPPLQRRRREYHLNRRE